ncbi:MAG: hypothetical protein IT370_34005 [Deltaproteobacteria bacterium]|nr:hypothetical protein [Deltaproteobacteria bacterium]
MGRMTGVALALAVAVAVGLMGCGDDDDGGTTVDSGVVADASGPDAAVGCVKRWRVQKIGTAAVSSATVESGALVLRSSMSAQTDLLNLLPMMTLTGDFSATIRFENFVAGGMGAFVQSAVADPTLGANAPFATAAIGNVPLEGLSAAFKNPAGVTDVDATTIKSGEFQFVRTGGMLTVTAVALGGTPASTASQAFTIMPLQLGLQIGTNSQTFDPETSIRITEIAITGGGAGGPAQTDDFSCDSIMR